MRPAPGWLGLAPVTLLCFHGYQVAGAVLDTTHQTQTNLVLLKIETTMFLLLPLHYLHYLQCFAACVTCHVTRTWNEAINLVTSNYVICWTAVNTENVSWWFQHFFNQWLEGILHWFSRLKIVLDLVLCCQVQVHTNRFYIWYRDVTLRSEISTSHIMCWGGQNSNKFQDI